MKAFSEHLSVSTCHLKELYAFKPFQCSRGRLSCCHYDRQDQTGATSQRKQTAVNVERHQPKGMKMKMLKRWHCARDGKNHRLNMFKLTNWPGSTILNEKMHRKHIENNKKLPKAVNATGRTPDVLIGLVGFGQIRRCRRGSLSWHHCRGEGLRNEKSWQVATGCEPHLVLRYCSND